MMPVALPQRWIKHHYLMTRGHWPWQLQHSLARSHAQTWHFHSAGKSRQQLSFNQLIIQNTKAYSLYQNKQGIQERVMEAVKELEEDDKIIHLIPSLKYYEL